MSGAKKRHITNEELEALYKLYPKRLNPSMGKATGHKRLKVKLDSEKKILTFIRAVESIAACVKDGRIDRAYVPMWSTFANRYEDYLPENLGEDEEKEETLEDFLKGSIS